MSHYYYCHCREPRLVASKTILEELPHCAELMSAKCNCNGSMVSVILTSQPVSSVPDNCNSQYMFYACNRRIAEIKLSIDQVKLDESVVTLQEHAVAVHYCTVTQCVAYGCHLSADTTRDVHLYFMHLTFHN